MLNNDRRQNDIAAYSQPSMERVVFKPLVPERIVFQPQSRLPRNGVCHHHRHVDECCHRQALYLSHSHFIYLYNSFAAKIYTNEHTSYKVWLRVLRLTLVYASTARILCDAIPIWCGITSQVNCRRADEGGLKSRYRLPSPIMYGSNNGWCVFTVAPPPEQATRIILRVYHIFAMCFRIFWWMKIAIQSILFAQTGSHYLYYFHVCKIHTCV